VPKPNKAMREEAQRGLNWRKEYGRGGTDVGVARARDIANNRDLSLRTVRRMNSYFARHGANLEEHFGRKEADGGPSAFRIAWALWGGNAGRTWAKGILSQEEYNMIERAEPDELSVGDFVSWDSSGGSAYGQIRRIERDGSINVPDSDFKVNGTEDDPAALIMLYRENEEGFAATGQLVGHRFSTLTKVDERKYHKDKDKYKNKGMRESRPAQTVEIRSEDDGSVTVEGYAAVFNEQTVIGGQWREQIARGAFSDAISRDDVVFLINHAGLPLARTRSGTLQLSEDDHGLKIRASLDTSDPDVRAIVPKMKRGDLDKMSFAFVPTRQNWDDKQSMPVRTIEEASLFDVSIVTTPAYDGTEIGLRSLEIYRQSKSQKSQAARRMRMRLRLQE